MSRFHRWLFPAVAALALAAPVSAQWKPAADASPEWTASTAVTLPAGDIEVWNDTDEWAPASSPYAAPDFPGVRGSGEDVALMVVGGAALVVGSIIDGDAGTLMMVGGGVIGLLGLFRYVS